MAPKGQGKKNVTKNETRSTAQESITPTAIDYNAAQTEEIEALQAIFMEDYEDVKADNAWSKTSDRRFRLRIAAFSDDKSAVMLSVHLTATYPKTVPLLEVDGLKTFHERTQKRINNVITNRPKQLLGEVMIHAIATEIQEALEDAVLAKQQGVLPSLEDERANAEEMAIMLAKQAEDAELRRRQEAQEEEQRVLDQMVDRELVRREKRKGEKPANMLRRNSRSADTEIVDFDKPGHMRSGKDDIVFTSLEIVGKDGPTLLGKPLAETSSSPPLVAIRKLAVKDKPRDYLVQLEISLDQVRNLRHPNLVSLYTFSIERESESFAINLCLELSGRGTLRDLLDIAGAVHVEKARRWSIELLEALEECHRHGITHGVLTTSSVLLFGTVIPTVKIADVGLGADLCNNIDLPVKWQPPDSSEHVSKTLAKKTDIWLLGTILLQMCIGQNVTTYTSPSHALDKIPVSDSFEDLIERMCNPDSRKRPTAFDLLATEFLRSEAPVLIETNARLNAGMRSPVSRRSRHNSSNGMEAVSRYAQDFTEVGRLGKGGFGEVVKARNKLDGGIYAIKKISRAPQLDQILSEVMLLNRLNHPYVVRYYSTWVEETMQVSTDEPTTSTDETVSDGLNVDFGFQSTGGLDFVSSSGYPRIEFGVDSDEDDDEEGVAGADESALSSSEASMQGLRRTRSTPRKMQSTLYIQMEYCERRTMRDLIHRGIGDDDCWRYMRQVTEGLAHIHGHGIIHRDLKPDNVFIDVASNPKIGDFGLATTNQIQTDRAKTFSGQVSVDMTMSVGTAMYVAPELSSGSGTTYNDKVDMYSLGIIFYEMCEPFTTAMERIRALQEVRKKDHQLPSSFLPTGDKAAQGKVISCLVEHKPSERPSSTELLRTGLLPVKIEDETIRQALSSLSDPRSPNHQKMMSALFAHDQPAENRVKALAWDAKNFLKFDNAQKIRLRAVAKDALTSIFRLHGAENCQRETLFPRSTHYTTPNVFQLLDASGNLLQLPFDLALPMARRLARDSMPVRCSYTFGSVYRDVFSGGPPTANEEVDFDIVAPGDREDHAFDDAEILNVMNDISYDPALLLGPDNISFHVNHAAVLDAIFEHCHVPRAQYLAVKECLSKLGFRQFNWSRIRSELRSAALNLPTAIVDDLEQFDFRDTMERATARLRDLLQGSISIASVTALEGAVVHLQRTVKFAETLGVKRKIWLAPFSCFNAKFYSTSTLVQMVHDKKTSRDVLAAGGRYDDLIRSYKTTGTSFKPQSAIGISIGLDRLVANMDKIMKLDVKTSFARDPTSREPLAKRCDVLIMLGSGIAVHDAGMKLISNLWSSRISAEMMSEGTSSIDEQQYAFVVSLRHEASTSVKVRGTSDDASESDVPIVSLVSYLLQELRDLHGTKRKQQLNARHPSQANIDRKGHVQVLTSQHRSKKSNKYHIVEAAQQRWAEKLDQWKDSPILAVETRDDVVELIRDTRLGDAESWRKALHAVPVNERQYFQQIQELLMAWRKQWSEGDQAREVCVFNFRTGHGIYYDIGL